MIEPDGINRHQVGIYWRVDDPRPRIALLQQAVEALGAVV